jgi:CheY-like chemotaxis protein
MTTQTPDQNLAPIESNGGAGINGAQFQGFQKLMRHRILEVLFVASLYDLYIFDEDERLYELVHEQYQGLNLTHAPEFTRVSKGKDAKALLDEDNRFDLIIATLHLEDMSVVDFVKKIREAGITTPIVLMAFDNREVSETAAGSIDSYFDQVFIWQGDYQLIMAIIKHFEDKLNVQHDTHLIGVQSIIVVEDNIRYYSSFLPIIYLEVMNQSQRLLSESISQSHIQLRQRARPKILLCKTYEEAWGYIAKYHETILGVISDIGFPHNGELDTMAGLELAKNVRSMHQDIPILLHSNYEKNREKAEELEATFLLKDSPTLLHELRRFMKTNLSFGEFVFRTPDGREHARAKDLLSLEKAIATAPALSIKYHAERNHFSNWLKARTEFDLALKLRPRKMSDFGTIEQTRISLILALQEYRQRQQRGIVMDFHRETFDPISSISRIGNGSLGGKARGLAFVSTLINKEKFQSKFDNVEILIPAAVVLSSDIFDQFVQQNNLHTFALAADDDPRIMQRFLAAETYPSKLIENINILLEIENGPLAVRSSSLLEDSRNQPFAGVYNTYMLPNKGTFEVRRAQLLRAIKRVYASTFLSQAKHYIKATSFRLEEERMAVIIQKLVGKAHQNRFYPDLSGVARSHNFYPIKPQTSKDGIVSIALGLGKMVVEGGASVRFCPKYPTRTNMQGNTKTVLAEAQDSFYSLNLTGSHPDASIEDKFVQKNPLSLAEEDGTLAFSGSTYSIENDAIYEGVSRAGRRMVTFASLLKNKGFPLAKICKSILKIGSRGMGIPVEIEFAASLSTHPSEPHQFGILQMRPMVLSREMEILDISGHKTEDLFCKSSHVLGNGIIDDIFDVVFVNRKTFDRSKSRETASIINKLNTKLLKEEKPYLLVGVGRWGSLDPWLGIPVSWDMINGARAIVETDFIDFRVSPSQGSHFFQNLTSFQVGYFTLNSATKEDFLDWDWLMQQNAVKHNESILHLQFDKPIVIKMNGHENKGVILKPGSTAY